MTGAAETLPGAPSAARVRHRWARRAALGVLALLVAAAAVRFGPMTAPGRWLIEAAASGMKVGRVGVLRARGFSGDLWSDFRVEQIEIADGKGPWLIARGAHVRWRPLALLERRVQISTAEVADVTVLRRPRLGPANPPGPAPVSVRVDRFRGRLETAPAFSQVRGDFDVAGGLAADRAGAFSLRVRAQSRLHRGDYLHARIEAAGTDQFAVDIHGFEAGGGAVAGALGLAADQPFALDGEASAVGPAGAFRLVARVGASTPALAYGRWNRQGGTAQGTVELAASKLLAPYQDIIGPRAAFTLSASPAEGGRSRLRAALTGSNLILAASGEADISHLATGPGGLAITAHLVRSAGLIGWAGAGAADARLRADGDLAHWTLSGSMSFDDLSGAAFRLASLAGPVRLEGQHGSTRFQLSLRGSGGAGRGAVAALLGARPELSAQGQRLADGRLLVRDLRIAGPGLDLDGHGASGLFGALTFEGKARLGNFGFAHPGARGLILADWRASSAGTSKPWVLSLDAQGRDLISGWGDADRLLGPAPRLDAKAGYQDGVWSVSRAELSGASGRVAVAGQVGDDGSLRLELDWSAKGPLEAGPFEVAGAAHGTGALTGDLAAPHADLETQFTAIEAPGLSLRNARALVRLASASGRLSGDGALAAESPYGPATAHAGFQVGDGRLVLSNIDVAAGGVRARGEATLADVSSSAADLTIDVGPGAYLTRGAISGRARLSQVRGSISAAVELTADHAVLRTNGLALTKAKLEAHGPLRDLVYSVSGEGSSGDSPWRLSGAGQADLSSSETRTLAFAGGFQSGGLTLHTLSPAQLRWSGDTLSAEGALDLGGGAAKFTVSTAAGSVQGRVQVTGMPIEKISDALGGRLDGAAVFSGQGERLAGAFQVNLANLRPRDAEDAPPLNGVVRGRLAGGILALDTRLDGAQGAQAVASLTLPARASASPFSLAIDRRSPISGRFDIHGDAAPVWTLLMGADRTLTGAMTASGTIGGDFADPRVVGSLALEGGRFEDVQSGAEITNISLKARIADRVVDVQQFSGSDARAGSIGGAGKISLDRDGQSSFRIDLRRFRLLDLETAEAIASGSATIARGADGRLRIAGALSIDQATIAPNPPTPLGVAPMDVIEIHRPPGAQAATAPGAAPAPISLDVTVKAPRGVFVKGRGLDVELAVDSKVGGTTAEPTLSGTARVIRGDYDFAGKRFEFDTRSTVWLAASPRDIRLDLTATRQAPTLTAVIKVSGTAERPKVTLTSTPALPADEILSQVLFGASASRLSAVQGAQLASAVASIGGGRGLDVFGGLRNLARLDRLAFGVNSAGESTVSGGKYLKDNVYLEVIGSRDGPSAQVEWRAKRNLSVVSRVGRAGDSQLSLRWRRDF
ncbi:MAG TPA: translocation/assembly module TamB domain-containing protein [Caulobacteraceae bacterium]|nr:translocation/assembly module TamB domain-containing protein [Caulobacteraceae bacterium]